MNPLSNSNKHKYVRRMEIAAEVLVANQLELLKLAEAFHTVGNDEMCVSLRSIASNIVGVKGVMQAAVKEEQERLISRLQDAPLAQNQELKDEP